MADEQSSAHVAVIEDDYLERGALGRVLEAGGFEPVLFERAETFMASRRNQTWRCLIVDVNLSGMSGIDLQRTLHDEGSEVPLLGSVADRPHP